MQGFASPDRSHGSRIEFMAMQDDNSHAAGMLSPDDIESTKRRLGKLLARERVQRQQQGVSSLSLKQENITNDLGATYTTAASVSLHRPLSVQGFRSNNGGLVEDDMRHVSSGRATLARESNRTQTLSKILNESDRLDPTILKDISDGMTSVNKAVLSADSVFNIIDIVHTSASYLRYFGVSDLQMWVLDDSEAEQIMWSMRSNGLKVSNTDNIANYLSSVLSLDNMFDAIAEVYPTSRGWTTTKSIVTSLNVSTDKIWGTWKSFRVFNVPCSTKRAILIAADQQNHTPNLTSKSEICKQYLQKLAMSICFKVQALENFETIDTANKAKKGADIMVALSSLKNSLFTKSSLKNVCASLAQAVCDTLKLPLSWCFLSFQNSSGEFSTEDGVVLMCRGHIRESQFLQVPSTSLASYLFHPMRESSDFQSVSLADLTNSCISQDVRDGDYQYLSSELCSHAGVKVVLVAAVHADKNNLDTLVDPLKEFFSFSREALIFASSSSLDEYRNSCLEIPNMLIEALPARLGSKYLHSVSKVITSPQFSRSIRADHCHLLISASYFDDTLSDVSGPPETCLSVISENGLHDSYNFFSEAQSKNWLSEIQKYESIIVRHDASKGARSFGVDLQGRITELFHFAVWLTQNLSSLINQRDSVILSTISIPVPGKRNPVVALLLVAGRSDSDFDQYTSFSLQFELDLRALSIWKTAGVFRNVSNILQHCIHLDIKDRAAVTANIHKKFLCSNFTKWRKRAVTQNLTNKLGSMISAFELFISGASAQSSIKSFLANVMPGLALSFNFNAIEDFNSLIANMFQYTDDSPIFKSTKEFCSETYLLCFLGVNGSSNVATGLIRVSSKDSRAVTEDDVSLLKVASEFYSKLIRILRKDSTVSLLRSAMSILLETGKQTSGDHQMGSLSQILRIISGYYGADEAMFKAGRSKVYSSEMIHCPHTVNLDKVVSIPSLSSPKLITSQLSAADGTNFGEFSLLGDLTYIDSNDGELALLQTLICIVYEIVQISQLSENYAVERMATETLKNKLSSSLGLIILSTHIIEARSVDELSVVLRAKLPIVVGCKKTFLMLPDSELNAFASTGPHDSEERVVLSSENLASIPLYASDSFGKLSKIVITHSINKSTIGYILCYDPSTEGIIQWQGLNEILSTCLSSYITSCMSKFDFLTTMAGVKQALVHLETVQQENEQVKRTLEDQRAEIISNRKEISKISETMSRISSLYESLLDLMNSYSIDSGSQSSSILEWLVDVTGTENSSGKSFAVKRESGVLSCELTTSRDFLGGAMEAIVKKSCVEVKCHLQSDSPLVSILLIPNIFLSLDIDSQYVCFAIVRVGEQYFEEDEKRFLSSAVNMCCRSLSIAETSPFTLSEFKALEQKLIFERFYAERLREITNIAGQFNQVKTLDQVTNILMSEDVSTLLKRSKEDIFGFTVVAKLDRRDFPSPDEGNNYQLAGLSSTDNSLMLRAWRSGEPLRQKNKLFHPVRLSRGPAFGMLFIERRFQPNSNESLDDAPKIEDLMINDADEVAISTLVSLTALVLENLERYSGASEGISQASSAIQALQNHIVNLEDAAAVQVAYRLQIEEARDKGLQLLSLSNSHQVTFSYLLESAKAFAKIVVSSDDCILIVPYKENLLGAQPNGKFEENRYYVYESTNAHPRLVRLDAGDIEYTALTSLETLCCPTKSFEFWRCWTARYLRENYGELNYDSDNSTLSYYIVSPFHFDDGAAALLVCRRRDVEYQKADIDCLKWLCTCLSLGCKTMVSMGRLKEFSGLEEYRDRCQMYESMSFDLNLENQYVFPSASHQRINTTDIVDLLLNFLTSVFVLTSKSHLRICHTELEIKSTLPIANMKINDTNVSLWVEPKETFCTVTILITMINYPEIYAQFEIYEATNLWIIRTRLVFSIRLFLSRIDYLEVQTNLQLNTSGFRNAARTIEMFSSFLSTVNVLNGLSTEEIAFELSEHAVHCFGTNIFVSIARGASLVTYKSVGIEDNKINATEKTLKHLDICHQSKKIVRFGQASGSAELSDEIIMQETSEFPLLTTAIPLTIDESCSIILLLLPSDRGLISIECARILKSTLEDILKQNISSCHRAENKRLKIAFDTLRNHRHLRLQNKLSDVSSHLHANNAKISVLERQIVDFSELSKAINSFSALVKHGLKDTWSQASKYLSSILSSHFTVDNLSLVILGSCDVMYEMKTNGSQDLLEENFAQSYDYVGPKVFSLVKSILLGTLQDSLKSNKIFSMSRQDISDSCTRNELWLIPVRTPKRTLAVLKIIISADTLKTGIDLNLEFAQSISVYFSDLFATVLYCIMTIDSIKAKVDEAESANEILVRRVKNLINEKEQFVFLGHTLESFFASIDFRTLGTNDILSTKRMYEQSFENLKTSFAKILGRNISMFRMGTSLDLSMSQEDYVEKVVLYPSKEVIGTFVFSSISAQPDNALDVVKTAAKLLSSAFIRYCSDEVLLSNIEKIDGLLENKQSMFLNLQSDLDKIKSDMTTVTASNVFYRSLADVLNRCLAHAVVQESSSQSIPSLLSDVCSRLTPLVPTSCVLSFAISKAQSDNPIQQDFVWFHAEEGAYESIHFPKGFRITHDMHDISLNLAKTCFGKKLKSSLNLNAATYDQFPAQKPSSEAASGFQILSYPILDGNYEAVGVLQLVVVLPINTRDIEDLCEDVVSFVGRSIFCQRTVSEVKAISSEYKELLEENKRLKFNLSSISSFVTHTLIALSGSKVTSADLLRFIDHHDIQRDLKTMNIRIVSTDVRSNISTGTILDIPTDINQPRFRVLCDALDSKTMDHNSWAHLLSVHMSEILKGVYCFLDNVSKQNVFIEDRERVLQEVSLEVQALRNKITKIDETTSLRSAEWEKKGTLLSSFTNSLILAAKETCNLVVEVLSNPSIVKGDKSALSSGVGLESILHNFVKICDKVVSSVLRSFSCDEFSISLLTKVTKSSGAIYRIFDSYSKHTEQLPELVAEGGKTKHRHYSSDANSVIERHFRNKNAEELTYVSGDDVVKADLLGIPEALLTSLKKKSSSTKMKASSTSSSSNNLQLVIATVSEVPESFTVLLRVLFASPCAMDEEMRNVISVVVSNLASLGNIILNSYHHEAERLEAQRNLQGIVGASKEKASNLQQLIDRNRRLHKVVMREVMVILDEPSVEAEDGRRTLHPASLNPMAASHDTCSKILSVFRTLLRGEGQAIILCDTSHEDETFRVMYTGSAIRWTGFEHGVFGLVSSTAQSASSLVHAILQSHKAEVIANINSDSRYRPAIDGLCPPDTPYLIVPLKGRTGSITGAVVCVRGSQGTPFGGEDLIAAEMAAGYSSVALYWCHGMSALHEKVISSLSKMRSLEESVLKKTSGRPTRKGDITSTNNSD